MVTLYGIKNCDTVKKARQWLDAQAVDYHFHDVRADGLERNRVEHWLAVLGAEKLINKRSTTWKQLSSTERATASQPELVELVLANPTLIRRPLLEGNGTLRCGFDAADYAGIFASA